MQYSVEQLNYFRICYVGFNLVPEGLRQIFRQEWNFRYKVALGGEWQETAQNGRDFYNNEGKRSRTKNARYLATIQNGNTAEWDCSCLFFAILFSDSIGTTLGPAVHKEVDDLRQVRNDIAHICEAKLTDAEFQSYIARVLNSFTSLGLPVKDIENVRKQTSFPTAELQSLASLVDSLKQDLQRKEVHLQQTQNTLQSKEEEVEALTQEIESKVEPFCILTSEPSHEVIKRSNDISRLLKKMTDLEEGSQQAVSSVYISGTPGSGKSQLARQLGQEIFSTRSLDLNDATFVATLNAESVEALAESYITLGKHLGITEYTLTNLETSKRENPKETIQHLKILILPKIRKFSRWLLIVDNVVELKAVRSFLPQTASTEWGHGQVLITTQDSSTIPRNAPHTYHESFSKGMEPEDAVELLKEVSGISDDDEQAENVAKILEYQPLALAAAAYYVQTVLTNGSPEYRWTNYLDVLRQGQREATEHLLASESSAYSNTMTTAIQMALNRAVETDEVLRHMFSFLSLCSSEFLRVDAVVAFVEAYIQAKLPEELIKAKILRSSFILTMPAEEEGPECLRLHNTVHEVLKREAICRLKPPKQIQNLATAITIFQNLLFLEEENFKKTGHSCAMLNKVTSHCKALLEVVKCDLTSPESTLLKELTSFIALEGILTWLCITAHTCYRLCDVTSANWISELACNLLENVSGNTREGKLVKVMAFLTRGDIYCNIGKYQEAKELYENALMIRKSIDDVNDATVAAIYNRLGHVYHQMVQYRHAKDFFEKALGILKTISSEDKTSVAGSYISLGGIYCSVGNYNEAKRLHEVALTILTRIHGDEHADLAHTYNKLGEVHQYIGEYKKATELHSKALTIQKRVYGEVHTDVARSCKNLGNVHHVIGEYSKAKDLYTKALMIEKTIHGEEHTKVASSYNSMGLLYHSIGETRQAKDFYEKAQAIYKKIFSEEHPDVATGYNNLGGVYHTTGQYGKAKELFEKALMMQKKNYGEEHPTVAACYNNLGSVYNSTGQFNQAKEFCRKALTIQQVVYGETGHDEVATSYSNLGKLYEKTREYNEAKELHEKALTIRLKVYDEKHIQVARSYSDLGNVYGHIGDCAKAQNLLEKALTIYSEFGEYTDGATSDGNLGHANAGQRKELMIQKKVFGQDHDHLAETYNNLGLVYQKTGEYKKARYLHEKALSIHKAIHGEENAAVSASYHNLARVYYKIGEYNQAKELQAKALKIKKKVFGEEHAEVATSYHNLAQICYEIGEYSQAKELEEKALKIREQILGEKHADVEASRFSLKEIKTALKNTVKPNISKKRHR